MAKRDDGDADLEETEPESQTGVSVDAVAARDRVDVGAPQADDRYEKLAMLGRGGMGEVRLCRDLRLGRKIAMKELRADRVDDEMLQRFLREARVQGQLEHPSIAPVYDAGRDEEGNPYFTMKRVDGTTLRSVLDALSNGLRTSKFSQRRLLEAFCQICLAVDYAHVRGVVHRDLKPANVMLGDFGEVTVLDWGIAKLSGESDASGALGEDVTGGVRRDEAGDLTQDGAVLGTGGYMPPERLAGAPASACTDVYALGAILFEILTLERLVDKRARAAGMSPADARERLRAVEPDVAPELAEACARAVEPDPDVRTANARQLHDEVRAFLDGQRDHELRLQMAEAHAHAAAGYADGADGSDEESRRHALREVGRALALDPDSKLALETLHALFSRPPTHTPREVEARLTAATKEKMMFGARAAAIGYATLFLYLPILVVIGVRDAKLIAAMYTAVVLAIAPPLAMAWTRRWSRPFIVASAVTSCILVATTSFVLGPFVIVPSFAVGVATASAILFGRLERRVVLVCAVGAVVGPLLFEWIGLLPQSYVFRDDGLLLLKRSLDLSPTFTVALLLVVSVATVVVSTILAGRIRDELRDAEARLRVQTWQLTQLAPAAESVTDPGRPSPALAATTTKTTKPG